MGKKMSKHFDTAEYKRACTQVKEAALRFAAAVKGLRTEGIDVTVEALKQYPALFPDFDTSGGQSYRKHFLKLYEEAVKKCWLPVEEKQRMRENFMQAWDRTRHHAQKVCSIMKRDYVFEDSDTGAVLNVDATQEQIKPRFMMDVDADGIQKHWEMLKAIRAKIQELNDYNTKHGIPQMGTIGAYDFGAFCAYILSLNDIDGNPIELTQEQHKECVWECFKIDKE